MGAPLHQKRCGFKENLSKNPIRIDAKKAEEYFWSNRQLNQNKKRTTIERKKPKEFEIGPEWDSI